MLTYLIVLAIGCLIGSKVPMKDNHHQKLVTIQSIALYFLLFIMGAKVGMDKDMLRSFGKIGLQGTTIALFSVIFSVLGVSLISKTLFKFERGDHHDL